MNVEQIPFEQGRFIVGSESDPESAYVVDLCWQEEPWNRPIAYCSCYRLACGHEKTCKHIKKVVEHELNRLNL